MPKSALRTSISTPGEGGTPHPNSNFDSNEKWSFSKINIPTDLWIRTMFIFNPVRDASTGNINKVFICMGRSKLSNLKLFFICSDDSDNDPVYDYMDDGTQLY